MIKTVLAAALLVTVLPLPASADSWTEGQADWAQHGFHHGAWDCYGRCSGAHPAHNRQTTMMHMACQQNIEDGRLQISNGNMLPEGARSRVVNYHPMTRDASGWSNGPCTVAVTR